MPTTGMQVLLQPPRQSQLRPKAGFPRCHGELRAAGWLRIPPRRTGVRRPNGVARRIEATRVDGRQNRCPVRRPATFRECERRGRLGSDVRIPPPTVMPCLLRCSRSTRWTSRCGTSCSATSRASQRRGRLASASGGEQCALAGRPPRLVRGMGGRRPERVGPLHSSIAIRPRTSTAPSRSFSIGLPRARAVPNAPRGARRDSARATTELLRAVRRVTSRPAQDAHVAPGRSSVSDTVRARHLQPGTRNAKGRLRSMVTSAPNEPTGDLPLTEPQRKGASSAGSFSSRAPRAWGSRRCSMPWCVSMSRLGHRADYGRCCISHRRIPMVPSHPVRTAAR
jgi:hypothetical protein